MRSGIPTLEHAPAHAFTNGRTGENTAPPARAEAYKIETDVVRRHGCVFCAEQITRPLLETLHASQSQPRHRPTLDVNPPGEIAGDGCCVCDRVVHALLVERIRRIDTVTRGRTCHFCTAAVTGDVRHCARQVCGAIFVANARNQRPSRHERCHFTDDLPSHKCTVVISGELSKVQQRCRR